MVVDDIEKSKNNNETIMEEQQMIQKERILKYIKDFGSITSWEAYQDLGITQLGARIFELKRDGYEFMTKTEHSKNRYGEKVEFTRYYLADDMTEQNMEHIPCIE